MVCSMKVMLPLLFWRHPFSWHSVMLPGDAVLNRSLLACDHALQLFPEKSPAAENG